MRTLNLLFLTIALAAGCGTSGNDQHEDGGSGATGPDGAARGGAETGTDDGAPPDATSPTVDASADAAIEAASGGLVTVGARVVDWTGQGISELPVSIGGQLVHTDANGRAMATVRAPYDLVTLDATDAYAIAFYALTRSDPVVTVPVVHAPAGNATLAVNLTGTTPGGMIAVNAFSASIDQPPPPDQPGLDQNASGSFQWPIAWNGPASGTEKVVALEFTASSGVAKSFQGFGTAAVSITNGQPASVSVPLSPVSAATLAGTVTLPPSFSILGYNLFLYDASDPFAPTRVHFTSESGNALSTSFSFAVPSGPNLGVAMYVIADGDGGTASAFVTNPGTAPVSIVLGTPPKLVSPPVAPPATGVTTETTLGWTAVAEDVAYMVQLTPTTMGALTFLLFTGSTSAKIPDLSPLGGSLPKESGYEWDVISSGPVASVDALAVLSGRAQRFPSQTDSNLSTFTTQ